jgi:formamidopyrimidine-DNA glycosylase
MGEPGLRARAVPELPEVETVRRMLATTVVGRTIRAVRLSGAALRERIPGSFAQRLRGLRFTGTDRHGKYLLLHLDAGVTLLSHLGMSGRWLFFPVAPRPGLPHVHARVQLADGAELWFQDARRFGLLRLVATTRLGHDPALAALGPDPVTAPLSAADFRARAHGTRVSVKSFLLDQRRLAGLGNIYASEILFRAGVDPRRRAGVLRPAEWEAIAAAVPVVLGEALERMGTTFSTYRTIWNEPGQFAERLAVYDRAGEPCRRCGTPIRRIVQGQRSTFFCPACQARGSRGRPAPGAPVGT